VGLGTKKETKRVIPKKEVVRIVIFKGKFKNKKKNMTKIKLICPNNDKLKILK